LWLYDDGLRARRAHKRTERFLTASAKRLDARSGARAGAARGALFRVCEQITHDKVGWQDLADNLNAVALPRNHNGSDGQLRTLVPLNTIYFIPVESLDAAMLLAGVFNSLPV